jgi:cation diffusion facilitator CzcD-associated flavoprotein CzcO
MYSLLPDFGGVWLENRYPGVACDIPAPCFTWLFEDNPQWSSYYASGQEINEYVRRIAYKYHVDQYVSFKHYVTEAKWNENRGVWSLRVKNTVTDEVCLCPTPL